MTQKCASVSKHIVVCVCNVIQISFFFPFFYRNGVPPTLDKYDFSTSTSGAGVKLLPSSQLQQNGILKYLILRYTAI